MATRMTLSGPSGAGGGGAGLGMARASVPRDGQAERRTSSCRRRGGGRAFGQAFGQAEEDFLQRRVGGHLGEGGPGLAHRAEEQAAAAVEDQQVSTEVFDERQQVGTD